MEKNKRIINILLIVIMILVIVGCILAYFYFTKDKTKAIMNPEEIKSMQNEEKLFSVNNYPRVDSSIATFPLAVAYKANFTGKDLSNPTDINELEIEKYSKTSDAYEKLIKRETDLILGTTVTESDKKVAEENGVELEIVPILKEGFVFFVNKSNPVDNLTLEQVQDIYSGKIRNWKEVGGEDKEIIAYQKPENSASQIAMKSLVMRNNKLKEPVKGNISQGTQDIVGVISEYNNEKYAIGYSYYYYVSKMYNKNEVKILSIDGKAPNEENIETGLYGLQTSYYAIIRKDEPQDSDVRKLLNAMKSERGQNIAKEAGYVQNY